MAAKCQVAADASGFFCQFDSGCQFFHKRAPSAIDDMTDYELVSQKVGGHGHVSKNSN